MFECSTSFTRFIFVFCSVTRTTYQPLSSSCGYTLLENKTFKTFSYLSWVLVFRVFDKSYY